MTLEQGPLVSFLFHCDIVLKIVCQHKYNEFERIRCTYGYGFRRGPSQHESIQGFHLIFGDEAPSRSSVYSWFSGVRLGRRDELFNDLREVR
ncbi:hypothetical protein EVAR_86339_1 [Eumeta japonica]|uniref:Mos1 transposase HTH domain-containing protein n=1 Tax=Eumeta variegata TaxID=151549 RepID=A0A4C1X7C8_EUMVA|nr:hypothetical protein EVAR_86339_1 [Eumeta japonica]